MEYVSTTQIAKVWGVSRKTVNRYAAEGKIEGAYLVGNTWMIPADAQKADAEARTADEDVFHFPLYLYRNFHSVKKTLTKPGELKLYSAFETGLNGDFDKAYRLAEEAFELTEDVPVKITCLYVMARCSLYEHRYPLFMKHVLEMNGYLAKDFDHKNEMNLLLIDIETYFKGFDSLLNASFDIISGYSSELFPIVTTMTLYKHILVSLNTGAEIDTPVYEMALKIFEENGYIYPSILLSSELAVIFHSKGKNEFAYSYAKYAYDLALKYNGFIMLIDLYSVAPKVLDKALKHYKMTVDPELVKLTRDLKNACAGLMWYLKKPGSMFGFINDDYDYICYAVSDYTNRQIAAIKQISESTVSQKYKRLFRSFNAGSKKELVATFLERLDTY